MRLWGSAALGVNGPDEMSAWENHKICCIIFCYPLCPPPAILLYWCDLIRPAHQPAVIGQSHNWEQWMSLWALTSVGKMNQRLEGIGIHTLHFDLLLFGLPHIIGEHGSKVIRHRTEDQSEGPHQRQTKTWLLHFYNKRKIWHAMK